MKKLPCSLLATTFLCSSPVVFANDTDVQTQLNSLKKQVESLQSQVSNNTATKSANSDTTIGGYGEIAFNDYRNDSTRNQADLKRFVLFFGHRFNDQLSFNSEVEWEHAVTSSSDQGESEIEQAYLNYQLADGVNLKTGLFLMPFGFLNESHEPPVFYGVERNAVETRIIPSTWREGGIGLYGSTASGIAWDTGITTGFDIAKLSDASAPLAASHQELQFAKAHNFAVYGALNYRGVPGLTVGTSIFSGDTLQGNADYRATPSSQPNFSGISARTTLWDVHSRWQQNGWDLQAIYAKGMIANADKIDAVLQTYNTAQLAQTPPGATKPWVPGGFYGWLMQGAYTVWQQGDKSLTPFVRYEKVDTQAQMPTGIPVDGSNSDRIVTTGLSFKPHPQVVFKADYQKFKDHTVNDRFNLGLGYMF